MQVAVSAAEEQKLKLGWDEKCWELVDCGSDGQFFTAAELLELWRGEGG